MQRLLHLAFDDRPRVMREIAELSRHLPPTALDRLDLLLAGSPAPERALQFFVRLRERQPASFERLTRSPAGLRYLIAIFANSRFLAEEVLEHPGWIQDLLESGDMHRMLDAEEYRARLQQALAPGLPSPLDLAKFRRRQILRIVVRDVLGFGSLPELTGELSALADAIVETAYERIREDLVSRFGMPRTDGAEARFSVIALGKLGGQELNYSSDIDLMFLYSGNGETDGRRASPTRNFSSAPPTSSPRCSPPTPPKGCVIASICDCVPKAAWAKCAFRSTARAIITTAARAIGNCR